MADDKTAPPPATRCYWVVPKKFLAGAYPGSADPSAHEERVRSIWRAGARTFINLVEETEKSLQGIAFSTYRGDVHREAALTGAKSTCVRLPFRDGGIPTHSRMRSILDIIDLSLDADRMVYVHCFGGVGRTATVVGCWLLRHGMATSGDVLERIARLRAMDRERRDRRAPETQEQIDFVKAWSG